MRYLLDTHILIWTITDDAKLPAPIREIILNADNVIYFSAVSIWETEIKHLKRPEALPLSGKTVERYGLMSGFAELPLYAKHIGELSSLHRDENAKPHNDPFDRILISQAKGERMQFLTHDALLADYHEGCVVVV